MVDNLIKAGEHGYVEAQFILGDMYEDGDEVVKDEKRATYWYEKAVEQGHKGAKKH
ncbi:tetratricopeptide repeat protein [Sulfurovum sp. CS9]|uniref:tetratricopeptide repeat protein n=1 Tax=Sulfurovum sp. CS9 TaxID=3391146 RepID=UPI0039E77057